MSFCWVPPKKMGLWFQRDLPAACLVEISTHAIFPTQRAAIQGDACYFKHEMMDGDRRDVFSRNEEMDRDLNLVNQWDRPVKGVVLWMVILVI